MSRISNKLIISMFVIFIIVVNIFNISVADSDFSETENRFLSQFPKLNYFALVSGSFTDEFEKYIADQFPFRNLWIELKSNTEKLMLKTKNNGIFFGKDGYLMEDYEKPTEQLLKNIKALNSFNKKLPDVSKHLLLVPNSIKINEDKLPLFATPYNQLKTIETVKKNLNTKINFVDIYNSLINNRNEYIYFKTDHHWTMRGAYYAYKTMGNKLEFSPYELDKFNSKVVTNKFYGTFYSKTPSRYISPDYIEVFTPNFDVAYEIIYHDTKESSDSLYEYDHLNTRDKYSLFLDGNHALTTINTNIENNKKLVILKDSYSHALIPFLSNHYSEIHIIDLRYYNLDVYDYIEEHNIEESLFIYNVDTFSKDRNIQFLQ